MLASCGGGNNSGNEGGGSDAASSDVPFTTDGLLSLVKTPAGQPITMDEYAAIFANYSKVAIDPKTLELDKKNAVSNELGKNPELAEYVKSQITNDNPIVRKE